MDRDHLRSVTPVGPPRRRRGRLRAVVVAGILGLLVWRLGTGPFVAGVGRVSAGSLAAATGVAFVTTLCCAWRWTLVARRLGVEVPMGAAVAAYYRSQFVNLATPGGVLGDVERAVRHGKDVGDTGRSLRSVVWERLAGQVVLVAVAAAVLVVLPSPVRHPVRVVWVVAALVGAGLVAVVLLARGRPLPGSPRWPAPAWTVAVRAGTADARCVLADPHTRTRVLLASVVALAGHVLTFIVAARTAGASAATMAVLPLALVVILAMGLPNIAGWGPREGVAAWVFSAGGLGAQQGVTTAVVYGVIVFVGALPGALVLLVGAFTRLRGVARA